MSEDARCCGSGTCIIDPEGRCWCGQQWDGDKMSAAPGAHRTDPAPAEPDGRVRTEPPRKADESSA